ncbi:MAG: DegQ family serine endoprotease [Proteobacteria bacterium]|jgi:serine protease Do|nr:DegQ family serine endoprotease [Pseudomonadota bacterium]
MQFSKSSVFGLLGILILFSFSPTFIPFAYSQTSSSSASNNNSLAPAAGFADLIEQVSPAVVHVAVSGKVSSSRQNTPEFNFPPGSPFEDFFEQFRNQRPQQDEEDETLRPLGIGSGFIISADGYIVTNNHVVENADEITVTMTDGEEYGAELQGTDSKTDLALLKINARKSLPFVSWGDVDRSRVGDWVIAIGNPFGLGGSATTGIISAIGRDIRSGPYDDYLQVDAAINRGNSGGPLFNLDGDVIGINSAIYSPTGGSVGIGFSIPSNMARNVIEQLQESGTVQRGWLGVQIQPLDKDLAEGFGRADNSGALVNSIVDGSPAEKAKFRPGDIILEFDGKAIEEMRDLPRIVAETHAGDKVSVLIIRDGEERALSVVIDPYPEDDVQLSIAEPDTQSDNPLGAELVALTRQSRTQYRIPTGAQGVLVVSVNSDSLAQENGIRAGDLIQRVGRSSVSRPADVIAAVNQAIKSDQDAVVFLYSRGGTSSFMPFRLK